MQNYLTYMNLASSALNEMFEVFNKNDMVVKDQSILYDCKCLLYDILVTDFYKTR